MPPFAPQPSQLQHGMGIGSLGAGIGAGGGVGAAGGLLDEDMMDPLFDDDWLHEHNLDILFDLFEEEIESKGADANNGSSTIFSTSPVTSYFFGTSPSLASAIDLYDLLYFDNQQNNPSETQQQHNQQHTTTNFTTTTTTTGKNGETLSPNLHVSMSTPSSSSAAQCNDNQANTCTSKKLDTTTNTTCAYTISGSKIKNNFNRSTTSGGLHSAANFQQKQSSEAKNHSTNSITNAMRIKRGLKRGQCEGVSLLAKPFNSTSSKTNISSGGTCGGNKNSSNFEIGSSGSGSSSNSNSSINKNNSDKTSAKITNFKKSIMGNINYENSRVSASIDINNTKQDQRRNRDNRHLYHYHHHVHYITGCSVIREHAYALRGH